MRPNRMPDTGIPVDIYHAARQIYNLQHIYLLIGDQFDVIFADTGLQRGNSHSNMSVESLFKLWLVIAFQYAECIPDAAAADASRKRVDWKYALHLPVHHQGVSSHALCAFRQNMYESPETWQDYDRFINRLGKIGLYSKTSCGSLTTGQVLGSVCNLTRLHLLNDGMKEALVVLITRAPTWLLDHMPPYWYTRYQPAPLLQQSSKDAAAVEKEAAMLGTDIHFLLTTLREHNLTELLNKEEIQQVKRHFDEQFLIQNNQVQWRLPKCANCTQNIEGGFDASSLP